MTFALTFQNVLIALGIVAGLVGLWLGYTVAMLWWYERNENK